MRRNAVIGSPKFQHWASRIPFMRTVARKRAAGMFDLIAGFAYSKVLYAMVESGLVDFLSVGASNLPDIAAKAGLDGIAADRLMRAAASLDLVEEVAPDRWMLGEQGAALHSNSGAKAMIRHHRLLYRDLIDPLALLRNNRAKPTELSRYWSYAGALHGHAERGEETNEYSELMAMSQHFVAEQVLAAFPFRGIASVLDVGGGSGAFIRAIGAEHPIAKLGVFDLPEVATGALKPLQDELGENRVTTHSGNFFTDPIPGGYDLITLSRILHDHDDEPALTLLRNIHASLTPGKRLLIAEPLSGVRGAKAMGDAFFGLYLWAMGSGRPRTTQEITALLKEAGFAHTKVVSTPQPVVAGIIVASA